MTKRNRRAVAAAMLPPKPPPKTHRPPPDQLPAMAARFHFSPEVEAARLIVEHWISHVDSGDPVSGQTFETTVQVRALMSEVPLTLRQRQVLDLRADGRSWATVADALDLDISTVRSHSARAVAKLREALDGRN